MHNIVTFSEPKFKPLPGALTPSVINGAILPRKIEEMGRARLRLALIARYATAALKQVNS